MTKIFMRFLLILLLLVTTSFVWAQETEVESDDTTTETSEEETYEDDDTPVTLNFVDMELSEVITNISKITGKNFIWDEKVRGKVTIISSEGIPTEEVWLVFQAVLRFNGYQLVKVRGITKLYKIVRVQEVSGETIPTYSEGLWSPRTEAYVTRLLKLKYIDPQSAAAVLNNLKSKDGKIIPYPPTNTLIVIESANNLNRLVRILVQMDIPVKLPQVKIVPLQHAPADKLASELSQIFSDDLIGALTGGDQQGIVLTPSTPNRRPPRRSPESRTTTQQSGKKGGLKLKIIPDTRTNFLIIIATELIMAEVLKVIDKLDIPIEGEEGIYVYYCRNATATELASTLSSLTGGSSSARTSAAAQPPRGGAAERRRAAATPKASAAGGSITVGTLSGEVKITADEATNSLIIVASRRDYAIIRQVIEKLDLRRRQVFVEAVILEIEMADSDSLGTSFAGAAGIDNEAAVFASTALGGLNSMGILPAVTSGAMHEALPGGFSVGALTKTVALNIGGTKVEVPAFSALFNAMVSATNSNVLSTPNLLTTDNEEAEIVVGQNVPIPTGETVGTAGTTTRTIQRQNVGIKLKVTPQISESDTIRLVIFTEISGVVQESIENTLGLTTTIRTAQTTVVVDNHQTVVIGGLIENRRSYTTSKVPFLGDVPILGWLFKFRSRSDRKTNLVIMLTPHIVRDADELSDLTDRYNRKRIRFLDEASGGRYRDPFYLEPLILPEEVSTSEEIIYWDSMESDPEAGGGSGKPSPENMTPFPEDDIDTPLSEEDFEFPEPDPITPENGGAAQP